MVKILMENSVTISIDLNANDYGGKTAFIIACQREHADTYSQVSHGKLSHNE